MVDLYFYGNIRSIVKDSIVNLIEIEAELKIVISKGNYMGTLVECK